MNEYYSDQAGSGISYFQGDRFQRGNGFFGNFFKGSIMPLLKKVMPYLGRQALDAGVDLAAGLKSGESFKEAAKGSLKRRAGAISADALKKVRDQVGQGVRQRKRRVIKRKVAKRPTKRRKVVKGRKPVKRRKSIRRKKKVDYDLF